MLVFVFCFLWLYQLSTSQLQKGICLRTKPLIAIPIISSRLLASQRERPKKKTSESGAACNSTNTECFIWLMFEILKYIFHVTLFYFPETNTQQSLASHFNGSHKTLPNWWKFARELGEFWQTIVDKFTWRKTALVQSNLYHLKIYHSTSAFIVWLL